MADFKILDQIYSMTTPADLAGLAKLNLGGLAAEITDGPFAVLQGIIDNDGRGMLSTEGIIKKFNELASKSGAPKADELKHFFDIHSSKGSPDFVGDDAKSYNTKDGPEMISAAAQIVGKSFKLPENLDVTILCSRSPFFHPSKRHTKRVELFLNAMPSTIIAQMVPYLDIEFKISKQLSPGLPYLNQLRFLLGDVKPEDLSGANKAMLDGHLVKDKGKSKEYDFAGMEMFTSPQMLVNPTPNYDSQGRLSRYSEISDPFRPFASIESFTINHVPTVGMMTYKKAQLVLKLHDRARLAEISDLIRPNAYGNVTIWATYGWRAPMSHGDSPASVPYFEFINNNMLMREAYGVHNASFSFDQVGQVVINLELHTMGAVELRTTSITHALDQDGKNTSVALMNKIKKLAEDISEIRKRLKLDPPEGINKEIRAFQVLDAAQTGNFPDMKASEVDTAISELYNSLRGNKKVDQGQVKKLIADLKELYKKDKDNAKFSLKTRIKSLATEEINKKFLEVQTGPDPFLVDESKTAEKAKSPLFKVVKEYQTPVPKGKVDTYRKRIVSFGKLFTVFAMSCIGSLDLVDDLQVFFYHLNDQCGPVSGHSIAEFPIDMVAFLDQYRDFAVKSGGESVTLEQFLNLIVNAQILDDRAVGYGLRSYYEPYSEGKEAKVIKAKEKDFEKKLSAWSAEFGPFKKPVIQMFVETGHERVTDDGESDVVANLDLTAKQISSDEHTKKFNHVMRIHIFDKQVNPYKTAASLLRVESGTTGRTGFVEKPATEYAAKATPKGDIDELKSKIAALKGVQHDVDTGVTKMTEFSNAREIKDFVSQLVPTITYGSNGTTITNANLSTKADPLNSTVNMLRSNIAKNVSQPNGAAEGGVPLRVIPAQMTMTTLGCPLGMLAQLYFIDFNTGTSIDNLYICTALQHVIAQGKFETSWTFGYSDAYGVFEGAPSVVDQISKLEGDLGKS